MKWAIYLTVSLTVTIASLSAITIYVPDDYPTIQQSIDAASAGDTVIVRPGTYVENIDYLGKAITVKSDQGPRVTVIDGGNPSNPDFGSVVAFQSGEGLDSVLDGFTLTNGTGNWYSSVYPANAGGGVFIKNASPTVKNNIITKNNLAEASGGGICCGENTSCMITNNIISGNSAAGSGGGIVLIECTPDATIKNNQIHGNWAGFNGGGISLYYCSNPVIEGNSIYENIAEGGDPSSLYYGGGGISCLQASPVIMNNYVAHNTCVRKGGGIHCNYESSPIIKNNFIGGNSGTFGGGMHSHNSSPTLSNNTFVLNSAENKGGAISAANNSHIEVIDSILWDNTSPIGPEIWIGTDNSPSKVSINYSDVKGGLASCKVAYNCTLIWGTNMIDADPLFAKGPCSFSYLGQIAAGQSADSPCVDAGSDLASNLGMGTLFTRTDEVPDAGVVDMGYHHGPFPYPFLQSDVYSVPESTGGTVNYLLLAGSDNAHRNYLLIGGVSGTKPGLALPGGYTTLPVNWDVFTDLVLSFLNTPIFWNFIGKLNANGAADAQLNMPPLPPPSIAGTIMHYAYCCNNPFDFVSNPVEIEIIP